MKIIARNDHFGIITINSILSAFVIYFIRSCLVGRSISAAVNYIVQFGGPVSLPLPIHEINTTNHTRVCEMAKSRMKRKCRLCGSLCQVSNVFISHFTEMVNLGASP